MNTAMPIESEEINGIESEESFSEKEHIRLVKEYAWDDSYVQEKLDIYDWEIYGQQRPSTAEKLTFAYGLCLDFDDDGENESFVAIDTEDFMYKETLKCLEEITIVFKPESFADENNLSGKILLRNISIE